VGEPGFTCPQCGTVFNPFAVEKPLSEGGAVKCPTCGYEPPVQQDPNVITGPVARPAGTRIKENRISEKELEFTIPGQGLNMLYVIFMVLGDAVLIALIVLIGRALATGELPVDGGARIGVLVAAPLLMLLFAYVAVGMVYAMLDMAFGKSMLSVGPERVRYHHELFGKLKNDRDLATGRIGSVTLVEKYVGTGGGVHSGHSYCNVVITGGEGDIEFGRDLTQDERRWICYEARELVRKYADLAV